MRYSFLASISFAFGMSLFLATLTLADQSKTKIQPTTKEFPSPTPEKAKANCIIKILSERKSGESSEQVVYLVRKSKDECAKDAQLHETNFAPAQIARKTVKFIWKQK